MAKIFETFTMSSRPLSLDGKENAPKIYWMKLCYEGQFTDKESSTVPRLAEIYERYSLAKNQELLGSKLFWLKLVNSVEVLLLDKHLNLYFINRLTKELTARNRSNETFSIKILSSKISGVEKKSITSIERLTKDKNGVFEWRRIKDSKNNPSAFPVHDRFACFDGELWHFGADIGGGHKSMAAFSCGWKGTEFELFFSEIWKTGIKI